MEVFLRSPTDCQNGNILVSVQDRNVYWFMIGACLDELHNRFTVYLTNPPTHRPLHVQVCREGPATGGDTQHDRHCVAGWDSRV